MGTNQQNAGAAPPTAYAADIVGCPRCHSEVAPGMQFCRSCGFRMFDGGVPAPNYAAANAAQSADWTAKKARRHGPHWLIWVIVAVIISSAIGGGLLSRSVRNIRGSIAGSTIKPVSYHGVDGMSTTDGGAMIGKVTPPGGPADQAGLVGGDIITSVDGMPVKTHDEFSGVAGKLPVGKTIDIAYVRDGVPKSTKLTTMSEDEIDRLAGAFGDQPHGFFGVNEWERVKVPDQNIYGVVLESVSRNRPAYISGLREGDIVIAIDDIPIRTAAEFTMRIDRAKPESVVKVTVMRGAERKEIPVTVGIDD